MIDFNSLTLKNNYIFNIVMHRPNLCKMCLERILDKKIKDISYPDYEKTIDIDIDAKSIRLDIYCEDEDTMYNVELQNGEYDALPQRSRYYQSMMDVDELEKGREYSELRNSIVIFICTFDPLKKGRHLYTFENVCREDKGLKLGDGTTKIFLNTKGTMDDIPRPLQNFLEYIDKGTISDDFTDDLEKAVVETRQSKKWRKRIMTLEEYAKANAKEEAKKAREEGREEGKAEERERLNKLTQLLMADNRGTDLLKAVEDSTFQDELLKEYNI